jgi:hypothetical protein
MSLSARRAVSLMRRIGETIPYSVRRWVHAPHSAWLVGGKAGTLIPSEFNIGNFERRFKQSRPWDDFFRTANLSRTPCGYLDCVSQEGASPGLRQAFGLAPLNPRPLSLQFSWGVRPLVESVPVLPSPDAQKPYPDRWSLADQFGEKVQWQILRCT